MRAQTVEVKSSNGRVLCCTVFRPGGKKLLARGHVISNDDIRVLESEGMDSIWVTELEDGEVGEDDAVCAVAGEMGCGSFEIRLAAGGRANLQATVKSAPFAVSRTQLDAVTGILKERGPILQARPMRNPTVGVLYTDPLNGERARQLFENIMHQRLEHVGMSVGVALSCTEDEASVGRSLLQLLRSNPAVIMIASTTAPAGPEDVVGRAMEKVGGHMERFLAPVEPGNLLLLAYRDDIPMISAPGCFRSAKANVVDLLLPPLLARYRVSGWEVGCLGHGGLLG
jgi:molybdenum cofactor cytidylyltransferase